MAEEFPTKLPGDFCDALEGIRWPRKYSKGKVLFHYGQLTRGIYLIQKGRVDLLLPGPAGGARLFEKAGPGVMLGLSEAMSGDVHKLTAQAADLTEVSFVSREDLLEFLRQNQIFCMQIVRLLSEDLHLLYHRFRCECGAGNRPRRTRPSHPSAAGNAVS